MLQTMEGDRDQKIAGPALQAYGGQHGPVGTAPCPRTPLILGAAEA
jgi:hypothetical protein